MASLVSSYDTLPTGSAGRLNYRAFVDVYVETNGDRKAAIKAAGYNGEDYQANARAVISKPEVKRAIAERAANQFFAQLPLGMKVLQDVLEAEHSSVYVDDDGHVHKHYDIKLLKLKTQVAMKMFELAQVKELAAASMALQAAKKKVDLNELADKLAQLAATGGLAIPVEVAGNSVASGFGGAIGSYEQGGDAAEDDESSSL